MDVYPEYETWKEKLDAQKHHDEFKDFIGLNPKNEYWLYVKNNKVYPKRTQHQIKNPYNPHIS